TVVLAVGGEVAVIAAQHGPIVIIRGAAARVGGACNAGTRGALVLMGPRSVPGARRADADLPWTRIGLIGAIGLAEGFVGARAGGDVAGVAMLERHRC